MSQTVRAWVGGLILAAATVSAQEQEPAREPEATDEAEPPREPVRKIRVLESPYQLASFYRSSPGPSVPMYFGAAPLTDRSTLADRYSLASYYRLGGGGHGRYSRYWTSPSHGSSYGSSRRFVPIRARRVGPSELCLVAPTFLAPLAPLTDLDR